MKNQMLGEYPELGEEEIEILYILYIYLCILSSL